MLPRTTWLKSSENFTRQSTVVLDTEMVLSIKNNLDTIHPKVTDHSPVLIGTVPIGASQLDKMIKGLGGNIGDVNTQHFHNTVEDQTH